MTDSITMLLEIVYVSAAAAVTVSVLLVILIFIAHQYFTRRRLNRDKQDCALSIAFFHPYCNAGGGGERVLWAAVKAIKSRFPDVKLFVYTGDINASPSEILRRAQQRFDISIADDEVNFVYIHNRSWLEAKYYPYFTLLGQSFGSVIVGLSALYNFLPDIYIDSTGHAFTLPLFKFAGCATACYVHYPTITKEMLKRVTRRVEGYNNRGFVARSPILTQFKLIYYRIFGKMYEYAGRFADTVMVNSSWTEEHINELWKCPLSTHRVYPPCDTTALKSLPFAPDYIQSGEDIRIVSVGQFRPEKDHPLQLKAMYELRQIVSESIWDRIKLTFVGSCRDAEDEIRVKDMIDLCKHLSLENNVEFKVNVSYEELKRELSSSLIGLHAMWNEHFGIGVVECMAAGQIMVAHRSGGPKYDIIEEAEGSRNGFLAVDECEYAQAIAAIIKMGRSTRNRIRDAARSSVDRFSVEEFDKNFIRAIEPLLSTNKQH